MNILWKPQSQGSMNPGGVSFLLPAGNQYGNVEILDQGGNVLDTLQRSNAGQGETGAIKFYSQRPGGSYGSNLQVRVTTPNGPQLYNIPNGGQRYEGTYGQDSELVATTQGSGGFGGGYPGGFAPGMAGPYGFFPSYLGGMYPDPAFGNFNPIYYGGPKGKGGKKRPTIEDINYSPIDPAEYDYVDPFDFAERYGDFNLEQIQKNFDVAKDLALKELDTELQGLESFVPAASALKRSELSLDNIFNQEQRLAQIRRANLGDEQYFAGMDQDIATQEADINAQRGILEGQTGRAETYASGRLTSSIDDRALELGIRSRAADMASMGGFGVGSSVARKASDLMSAEQRFQISQYGDSLLSQNVAQRANVVGQQANLLAQRGNVLGQKANLYLAPTAYSDAGSQVRVMPEVGAGRLTASALSEINAQTNIPTLAAFQGTIQQNQFQTGLEQQTNMFNATNDLNVQRANQAMRFGISQFNATGAMNASFQNAGIENAFNLGKFQYDVGFAGAVAGAAQTNANTEFALQQQAQAGQIFQDHFQQAQSAQQAGSIASTISALPGIIGAVTTGIGAVGSAIGYDMGGFGGYGTPPAGAGGGGVSASGGGGGVPAPSGGGGGGGVSPQVSYTPDIPGGNAGGIGAGTVTIPQGASIPSGYTPVGSGALPDGSAGTVISPDAGTANYLRSAGQATGLNAATSLANNPQEAVTRAALTQGVQSNLTNAGIYSSPVQGSRPGGVDGTGQKVFYNAAAQSMSSTREGSQVVSALRNVLDPFGTFSREEATTLDRIGTVASDAAFITQLNALQQNGDKRGFVDAMLSRLGQPTIAQLNASPENKAGLQSALTAYQLMQNWDKISPTQKALGLASLGIQGYKFATGENLASKYIVKPNAPGELGLNVGQALGLLAQGYNVYGLVKNWNQLDNIQKLTYGTAGVANLANMGQTLGMLGAGTEGAAVAGVSAASLSAQGFTPAIQYGVGAIAGQSGATIPAGYTAIANTAEGGIVAIPTATAESGAGAVSATGGSLLGTAAGVAGIAAGAYTLYQGWGAGGSKGRLNGAFGGTSMAAGLYALGATNPFLLAGVVALGVLSGSVKTGKHEGQVMRDGVRDRFKQIGLMGQDNNVVLADGTTFSVGVDGGGGKHTFRNMGQVAPDAYQQKRKVENGLYAYDVDYTNDLDYTSNMMGTALSRLVTGGKGTPVDQMGGQLGNAGIGNIGYGQDMTPENFDKMRMNHRKFFADSGVKSKADAYQLANLMFGEGRIDESELVATHQAINMIYDDNGYEQSQKLMNGRHRGIEVATSNASKEPATVPTITPPGGDASTTVRRPYQPTIPYSNQEITTQSNTEVPIPDASTEGGDNWLPLDVSPNFLKGGKDELRRRNLERYGDGEAFAV